MNLTENIIRDLLPVYLSGEASADGGRARLLLRGFPPEHLLSGTFAEGLAGRLEALFVVTGTEGTIGVASEPNRAVAFVARWWRAEAKASA